jgi:hypothetical protein
MHFGDGYYKRMMYFIAYLKADEEEQHEHNFTAE